MRELALRRAEYHVGLTVRPYPAALANQQQGVASSQDALNAQNYTPQQQLALAQLAQSIPAQNLGLLAQIGVPIAGLGSQSSGTTQGTQQMSGAQQFATLAGVSATSQIGHAAEGGYRSRRYAV